LPEITIMPCALFHAERILYGSKTALLIPAVPNDYYRTSAIGPHPDDGWRARDEGFIHGRMVHTVSHFGPYDGTSPYVTATGGQVSIRALPSRERLQAQVTEIRMVECARLSDAEIGELGYSNRVAYMDDAGRTMQQRKAWFVRIIPLSPGGLPA
jgi:hypothetical protein